MGVKVRLWTSSLEGSLRPEAACGSGTAVVPVLPSLDIMIVNWNTGTLLRDCLKSMTQARGETFRLNRVVVVDKTQPMVRLTDWKAFRNSLSLFFTMASIVASLLLAIKALPAQRRTTCCFSTPTRACSQSPLQRPLEFLEERENPGFGICGVRHVDDSRTFSTTCARFPTLRIFLPR